LAVFGDSAIDLSKVKALIAEGQGGQQRVRLMLDDGQVQIRAQNPGSLPSVFKDRLSSTRTGSAASH